MRHSEPLSNPARSAKTAFRSAVSPRKRRNAKTPYLQGKARFLGAVESAPTDFVTAAAGREDAQATIGTVV